LLLLFDLDDTLYSRTDQLPEDYTEAQLQAIRVFPGVVTLLQRREMVNVLVTRGDERRQRQKVAVLGIGPYFQRILVCPRDADKKHCFELAMSEFPDNDVWVIGNRLDSEIRYGKELGLKTIYLRHGKYSGYAPRDAYEVPDYEVKHFTDVVRILDGGKK